MRPSIAHRAMLLALSGARIALTQDTPSSDRVGQISQTITGAVPETSVPVPDGPVTETLVEEPGETGPADPGTTSSELTEPSSEAQSDTQILETTIATSSETDPIESTGTPTSVSETPSATDEDDDETEITLVEDPALLNNSTEPFIPVEITPEELLEEEAANRPITQITEDQAREIAVLEGSLFHDFVENAPAPVDEGILTISPNMSECDAKLEKRIWPFKDYKDVRKCIPIRSLEFDVHYNFILPTRKGTVPPDLWRRVGENHVLLTEVFAPLGITFTLRTAQNWWPPATGSNSDWTMVTKREERVQRWQRKTHKGDKMALNVWIVNGLQGVEDSEGVSHSLRGYATFPMDADKMGKTDGVVITQDIIDKFYEGTRRGTTLVHETGHWLGLYHTFGKIVDDPAQDCKGGDGLLESTHTPGHRDTVYECSQIPCASQDTTAKIYNWMSYSECRGGPGGTRGFTTDQKAAMYARSIYSRRGIKNAECNPSDPGGSISKRSTMQDLVDGRCPVVEEAAQELLEYDNQVVDASQPGPVAEDDEGDGSDDGDKDDAATYIQMLSSLGLGVTATTILFLLL